jgi:hypothetical protein
MLLIYTAFVVAGFAYGGFWGLIGAIVIWSIFATIVND